MNIEKIAEPIKKLLPSFEHRLGLAPGEAILWNPFSLRGNALIKDFEINNTVIHDCYLDEPNEYDLIIGSSFYTDLSDIIYKTEAKHKPYIILTYLDKLYENDLDFESLNGYSVILFNDDKQHVWIGKGFLPCGVIQFVDEEK